MSDGRTNEEEKKIQHTENINLQENKNVRRVGQTGDTDILDRYLRAVDENNALIRENADLLKLATPSAPFPVSASLNAKTRNCERGKRGLPIITIRQGGTAFNVMKAWKS